MSNLETLLAAFQTQLSDVMETVLKTAMFEITRLLEEGFLEEVKRKGQEVQSLKMRLQWTEKKLNDEEISKGGQVTGRCVDCAKKGLILSTNTEEVTSNKQQDDVFSGPSVKKEESSVDRWTKDQTLNLSETLPLEEDHPSVCPSPDRQTQDCQVPVPVEEVMESTADVKEEIVIRSSCSSSHVGVWTSNVDGKAGLESQNVSALKEMPTKQSEENDEELLRTFIKYSPQRSAACSYPAEVEHTPVSTDVSGSEMDTSWTGLLQNHGSSPEKDFDALKTSSDSAPLSSMSEDPQVTVQTSSALGVTVKQEVILQSDQCEGSESMENEARSKFVSRPAKQHRQSSGSCKQNHISHKAAVQEVMKVHPKSAVGLKLQAAFQQLQRPIKKTAQSFSSSTTAVLSLGHSPSANLNSVSRIPSTSKTNSPPPPSVPRPRLSDRQAAALGRNTASWIGIRSQHQSAGSNHSNPALHSSSHAGPRHLLRCGQCGKCFPHPSNLKAHLQTHTGERPFCCSLCGRSFTKLSNLKAHRRVHTGERPYCCSACGKRFTQKCNLKRHQRIHSDTQCTSINSTVHSFVVPIVVYVTPKHLQL